MAVTRLERIARSAPKLDEGPVTAVPGRSAITHPIDWAKIHAAIEATARQAVGASFTGPLRSNARFNGATTNLLGLQRQNDAERRVRESLEELASGAALAGPVERVMCSRLIAACAAAMNPSSGALAVFEQTLVGWTATLGLAQRAHGSSSRLAKELRATWTLALEDLEPTLPENHPGRALCSQLRTEMVALSDEDACRRAALGTGAITHLLDHGTLPVAITEVPGLAQLALMNTASPVQIRRFSGPLGADAPSRHDVAQGFVGDCYNAIAWAACAEKRPDRLAAMVQSGVKPGTAHVELRGAGISVAVENAFYTTRTGSLIYGSARADSDQATMPWWWPAAEAAYAQVRRGDGRYASLDTGKPHEVWNAMFGDGIGVMQPLGDLEPESVRALIAAAESQSLPLACGTRPRTNGLQANHIYMVRGLEGTGASTVVHLFNPTRDYAPTPQSRLQHFISEVIYKDPPRPPAGDRTVPFADFLRSVDNLYWAQV